MKTNFAILSSSLVWFLKILFFFVVFRFIVRFCRVFFFVVSLLMLTLFTITMFLFKNIMILSIDFFASLILKYNCLTIRLQVEKNKQIIELRKTILKIIQTFSRINKHVSGNINAAFQKVWTKKAEKINDLIKRLKIFEGWYSFFFQTGFTSVILRFASSPLTPKKFFFQRLNFSFRCFVASYRFQPFETKRCEGFCPKQKKRQWRKKFLILSLAHEDYIFVDRKSSTIQLSISHVILISS